MAGSPYPSAPPTWVGWGVPGVALHPQRGRDRTVSMDWRLTTNDDVLRAVVGRAAQRDPEAWEELYRRSYTRLFSYARRRLPDDAAAEDAVSETMMRALDKIDRFSWQGAGFDGWLYGIARNVIHEAGRRWGRHERLVDDRPSVERGPEDEIVARDQAAAVRLAFERLAPEEQELLELRVQGGLSSDEVGALLGKRPGAVRMAQARALQRLRREWEEVLGVA
jgi:RNA polymerase sigma-70 factor (ECF subfamily)